MGLAQGKRSSKHQVPALLARFASLRGQGIGDRPPDWVLRDPDCRALPCYLLGEAHPLWRVKLVTEDSIRIWLHAGALIIAVSLWR